jgi:membrane protease YdiL (CAAX protease family)
LKDFIRLPQQILLHLLPGLLTALAFFFLGTIFHKNGLPAMLGFYTATVLVLFPLFIGIPLLREKKAGRSTRFREVIRFLEPVPAWQMTLLVAGSVIWTFLVFLVARAALVDPLQKTFFTRLPEWLDLGYYLTAGAYSRPAVIATWVLGILFATFLGPLLEELYFRGYLLPRMPDMGWWTPLIGIILFASYHFWSPWLVLVRIVAMLPMYYGVWWKKNIWIGIIGHFLVNLVGDTLMAIPLVFP